MDLIADRYEVAAAASADGRVGSRGTDTVTGAAVTVLRRLAPGEPEERARELARLRRHLRVRHPHLAEVRAVDLQASTLFLVCEPLDGLTLADERAAAVLTVHTVQRIAADLLDALAALHRAGVTHGSVTEGALVLSPRPAVPDDLTVTLLPMPGPPEDRSPHDDEDVRRTEESSPEDDVRAAANLLLRLLQRVPAVGMEEKVLALAVTRALRGAGGGDGQTAGSPTGGKGAGGGTPEMPTGAAGEASHDASLATVPIPPLDPSAAAGGAGAGAVAPSRPVGRNGGSAASREPAGAEASEDAGTDSRGRRRWPLLATAVAAAAAFVIALTVLGGPGGSGGRGLPGRPAGESRAASGETATTTSPSPPPAPLPQTVPGLVEALQPAPRAAGPAGPQLLDALRGVLSGDSDLAARSALQLVPLVLDGQGLDGQWTTASRSALLTLMTAPLPASPEAAPACFQVVPGTPQPLVQQYAGQILDRLSLWRDQGLPRDQEARLRSLAEPVAGGQSQVVFGPCHAR